MNNYLVYSLFVGIAVGSILYYVLLRITFFVSNRKNKAIALFSYAIGFGVTWWLFNNTVYLSNVMESIVGKSVAIIFAVLTLGINFFTKKK